MCEISESARDIKQKGDEIHKINYYQIYVISCLNIPANSQISWCCKLINGLSCVCIHSITWKEKKKPWQYTEMKRKEKTLTVYWNVQPITGHTHYGQFINATSPYSCVIGLQEETRGPHTHSMWCASVFFAKDWHAIVPMWPSFPTVTLY